MHITQVENWQFSGKMKKKRYLQSVRQTMILCQYQAQFVDCMLQDMSEI